MIFVKDSVALILFSIGLATADVFTDLKTITYLYFYVPKEFIDQDGSVCTKWDRNFTAGHCVPSGYGGHPKFATALLVPFLLNYILSWLAWARLEKYRLRTFLWPALNLYPQYRAARLVKLLWTEPMGGAMEEKQIFERDISLTEVFVESVSTVLVLTIILRNGSDKGVLKQTNKQIGL